MLHLLLRLSTMLSEEHAVLLFSDAYTFYLSSRFCHLIILLPSLFLRHFLPYSIAYFTYSFTQRMCFSGSKGTLEKNVGGALFKEQSVAVLAAMCLFHECMQQTPEYGKLHPTRLHDNVTFSLLGKQLVNFNLAVCSQTANPSNLILHQHFWLYGIMLIVLCK